MNLSFAPDWPAHLERLRLLGWRTLLAWTPRPSAELRVERRIISWAETRTEALAALAYNLTCDVRIGGESPYRTIALAPAEVAIPGIRGSSGPGRSIKAVVSPALHDHVALLLQEGSDLLASIQLPIRFQPAGIFLRYPPWSLPIGADPEAHAARMITLLEDFIELDRLDRRMI